MEYSLNTINILHHIQTILPKKFLNKINSPNFKPNPQLSLLFPQRPNQLPAQPLPNPNNKNPQNAYIVEGKQFPTYMITPLDLKDVQLRYGRILEKKKPFVVIKEQDNSEEDSLQPNKSFEGTSLQNQNNENEK